MGDVGVSRVQVARAIVALGLAVLVAAATVQWGLVGALWSVGVSLVLVGLLVDIDSPPRKGRR